MLNRTKDDVIDGIFVVSIGGRAVDSENSQERRRSAGVPADEEETLEESHPSSVAARSTGLTAQEPPTTKVRHLAVSGTIPRHRYRSTNLKIIHLSRFGTYLNYLSLYHLFIYHHDCRNSLMPVRYLRIPLYPSPAS